MIKAAEIRSERSSFALIAIGIFKLLKSAALFALGVALVRGRGQDLGEVVSRWISTIWLGRHYLDGLIAKLALLSERAIDEFAVGSFIYATLLLVEGVGLCLRRRWAEFLTVIITGSLLPFELYELIRRPTIPRVVITLVNVVIVWYLLDQLLKSRQHRSGDGPANK